ncbi:MAG TPA: response regulator [Nannocystaceae bacterium]|nr:response regulator [Nannocystaceae bacterium]
MLRVLVVEDSETDAKLVARELRRTWPELTTLRVDTREELERALTDAEWDVVISDWSMPQFSALAALEVVLGRGLDLPFIVVSGTMGEETAVEAMRAGARDFVLKDRLARLGPAVARELDEHQVRLLRGRAEAGWREAEARFARLSESGIIGIAQASMSGQLTDANDAYLRMVGYTREDIGKPLTWSLLNPPERSPDDERLASELAEKGMSGPWEQELVHRDGHRVPVLVGVAMLDTDNCIAFVADLSERRRAEAALRRSEEQLRQAQKMEAIGSLAGGVAHDFNNLLSVILSYCGVAIADLPDGDPLRADLTEVYRAGERAAELTRQLLAFSRRQVLQPKLLDLGDIVEGVQKMLRRMLGEDVELVLERSETLNRALLDRGQTEQVIMNLVVNARDAMPTGGRLVIATSDVELDEDFAASHVGAKAGRHVMLSIADNGCGMSPETRARIFEPFFTTKEVRGTGLGLSTVHGIVQQSGGTIWVYSEIGLGTVFKIYFPVADGHAPQPVDAPRSDGAELRGHETILLVEDDPQVRALAKSVLRRYGYHVLDAQTGGDALLLAEQHAGAIDLLLTDVVMPRISGRELTERLHAIRPGLRALYMSGYTDDAVIRHGVLEANVAFLQKPFTALSLVRKIREVLATPVPSP